MQAVKHTTIEEKRLRVIFAGISALILTVGIARFAYTPMLRVMRSEAGLSALAGGWLATINYAGYMLGVLIASAISDLRSKFVLYRWGLIAAVATTAATGCTDNVYLWAILRFASGVSSIAGILLASGLILNWLLRTGQKPELGLHFIGLGLGLAFSGLCAAVMAGRLAWDGQWIALGLLGMIFFIPAWFWMPAPSEGTRVTEAPANAGRAWMAILQAIYFCAGFGYVVSATFVVAIVERFPSLTGWGNWIWVLVGLAAVPSSYLWDRAARAIGETPALMLAFALQTVSIILTAVSNTAAANVAAAILFGGTFAGIVSLTLALVGRFLPHNPAKAMARLTISYGVAQIIAPAMAGLMARGSGDYRGALFVAAAVMIAGIGLLALLKRLPCGMPASAAAVCKQ